MARSIGLCYIYFNLKLLTQQPRFIRMKEFLIAIVVLVPPTLTATLDAEKAVNGCELAQNPVVSLADD